MGWGPNETSIDRIERHLTELNGSRQAVLTEIRTVDTEARNSQTSGNIHVNMKPSGVIHLVSVSSTHPHVTCYRGPTRGCTAPCVQMMRERDRIDRH